MLIKKKKVYCFWCNRGYDMLDIYLNMDYEGSISCPKGHLVGNQDDEEWKQLTGEEDD